MKPQTVDALLANLRMIESEVEVMQSRIDAELLAANQQQYLARCFDLLRIELTALRTYLSNLR